MKNRFAYLFLLPAVMMAASCGRHAPKDKGAAALKGNWYKRYKGVVGNNKDTIVLSLYGTTLSDANEGLSYSGGTYYYAGKGEVHDVLLVVDTASGNVLRIAEEADGATEGKPSPEKLNSFTLTVSGTHANGRFQKANGAGMDTIMLEENYDNAYRLRILAGEESMGVNGGTWTGRASGVCAGIQPDSSLDGATADFILQSSLPHAATDTVKMGSMAVYIRRSIGEYLADFKKDVQALKRDSTRDDICMNRYELETILPVYNDKGMLMVKRSTYTYSCGVHGLYAFSYAAMDVANKKIFELSDIMQVDNGAINKLLNTEGRDDYKRSHKVQADFPADIKMPKDFYIDDKGITFCYNPGDVAGFVFGEVKLSIPYASLKGLLKPEFATRMGLRL